VRKKEQKRSNRHPRDTDHSITTLKEKKVQRGVDIPQSTPVKPEDKCNVLSARCLVIRKPLPLSTIPHCRQLEKAKAMEAKLLKEVTQCFEQKKH